MFRPAPASVASLLRLVLSILFLVVSGPRSAPATSPEGIRYRIAVIDVFGDPAGADDASQSRLVAAGATDLDGDGVRENIFHGDLVRLYVGAPGTETVPFGVSDGPDAKRDILTRLGEIRARRRDGERLDAVVFCWESSTLISAIADTLDPADRELYQAIVQGWGRTDTGWRLTAAIIGELEALAADGVIVVTIAGNSGPRWVNTYTFARGVIVVGAAEPDADGEWATRNPLIDTWAQSRYAVRLVELPDRPGYGYDINEDGTVDIDLRRGSSWFRRFGSPRDTRRVLQGTSFAAPTALRGLLARGLAADAD
ncbi:hypothetical protein KDM41_03750 [bacterium]|nr:hypothetical protein [bacterium]